MMNLAKAVLQLKNERERARRKLEQLDSALSALAGLGGSSGKTGRETENDVGGGAQTNCSGPARSLGQSKSRAKAGEKGCLASLKQKVRASFRPLSFLLPKLVVVREHEG